MNSSILSLLASYGIDPAYIIIGLAAITLIMIVLYICVLLKMKKLYKTYDKFMRGKDAESLEEAILKQFDQIEKLEKSDEEKKEKIDQIFETLESVYQKIGLVKYDAFREMSGKLSYTFALLDQKNNGIIISSMYSREGCYSYAKEIIRGESYINLSEEEKEALKNAINGDKIIE